MVRFACALALVLLASEAFAQRPTKYHKPIVINRPYRSVREPMVPVFPRRPPIASHLFTDPYYGAYGYGNAYTPLPGAVQFHSFDNGVYGSSMYLGGGVTSHNFYSPGGGMISGTTIAP